MESTVDYSCWATLPMIMGTVKRRMLFQGVPTVMSEAAKSALKRENK